MTRKWIMIFVILMVIAGQSFRPGLVSGDQSRLKMALLPIPDVLPVYVALERGYFREYGVDVEALTVGSAVERDQLMQAGSIDGMLNELSGAAIFNRDKPVVQIVSIARQPFPDAPLFSILVSPVSKVTGISDLSGVAIGVSKNTVIEYVTEQLLMHGGLTGSEIKYTSIPVLPERLQLLLSGRIEAVTLPEPLASGAIAAGAKRIVDDTVLPHVSISVLTFSIEALERKAPAVRSFMAAWDRAVVDLNADPEGYRELMLKKIRVPKNVQATYKIPPYPRKALPTREQWEDISRWLIERNLISAAPSYDACVNPEFLAR